MKIGEVAKVTGLSVSNIRFYEKKGLLMPSRNRESQYRFFSEEDVERLKKYLCFFPDTLHYMKCCAARSRNYGIR